MDLHTPAGPVRVPISSWQATLQTDTANYVQAVIPACDPWLLSMAAADSFTIYRRARLLDGRPIEYPMASAPLQTPTIDRGQASSTATIAGYTPALTANPDPPAAQNRTLQNVRQVSQSGGSTRIQADVDWLLRPGHRAVYGPQSFPVRYINYYVNADDATMYVGDTSQGA